MTDREEELQWLLRAAIGLCLVHFALLALVLNRDLDYLFNDAQHRLGPGTDFFAYYVAGDFWRHGESAYGHGPGFGFRYHPGFAAAVGTFLSPLTKWVAYGIWVGLQEVAYFFVAWRMFALLGRTRACLIALLLLTAFTPYYLEVYMGNSSFIVAALLLCAFELLERGRDWAFAVVFTLSILIKPIGLIFVPLLLFRRKFLVAAVSVGVVVITAVPFFVASPSGWHRFVQVNLESIPSPGWTLHAGNQGLHALVVDICARCADIPTRTLATYDQLPGACSALVSAIPWLFAGLAAVLTWRLRSRLGACLFVWSATYLLGYKDVWEHSYSFAIVALFWLYLDGRVARWIPVLGAIWIACPTGFAFYDVVLPPGPIDPEHHWSTAISFLHHATKPLGLLVPYAFVAHSAFARRTSGVSAPDS